MGPSVPQKSSYDSELLSGIWVIHKNFEIPFPRGKIHCTCKFFFSWLLPQNYYLHKIFDTSVRIFFQVLIAIFGSQQQGTLSRVVLDYDVNAKQQRVDKHIAL